MTLCCVDGVYGYLSYLVFTCGYQHYLVLHVSMLYIGGVWLPPLPGGYLWLLCVTNVTRYCMTLCNNVEYGYLSYLVVTCGYLWLPALPGIV